MFNVNESFRSVDKSESSAHSSRLQDAVHTERAQVQLASSQPGAAALINGVLNFGDVGQLYQTGQAALGRVNSDPYAAERQRQLELQQKNIHIGHPNIGTPEPRPSDGSSFDGRRQDPYAAERQRQLELQRRNTEEHRDQLGRGKM